MRRHQARRANGRFTENTFENCFGIRTAVCPCGARNPYTRAEPVKVGGFIDPFSMNRWDRPTICSHCGKPLPEGD